MLSSDNDKAASLLNCAEYTFTDLHCAPSGSLAAADVVLSSGRHDTAVIDLSDPVSHALICRTIDPEYENFKEIHFKCWQGTRLILTTDKNEELAYSETALRRFLTAK